MQQHYSSKTSNNLDHKQESSTNLNDNSEVEIVAVRPPVYGNIPLKKAPTSPRSSVTTYAHQANSFYKGPHFPIQPNNTNTVTENSSFKEKVAVAALNSIKNKASTNIYKSIPTQTETYCFTCNLQVPCLSALKKHYATIKHKRATEEQAKNSTPITSS